MKKQYIKDLAIGNNVNDIFYLRDRRQLPKRDGGKFLVLQLQDRTGVINGKIWDDVEELFSETQPGNFVKVQGNVSEYNGALEITIMDIQKIADNQIQPSDFIETTKNDIEKMYQELLSYFNQVTDPDYRILLKNLFADEQFVRQFKLCPASTGVHHGYLGGLLEHTLSMLRLAQSLPKAYPKLDYSLIITGLIVHDIGKISSYTYQKAIDHTDEGQLIGHIVRGYEIIKNVIDKIPNFPVLKKQLLLHIILSHHGLREYGSPITPKFAEAYYVHNLDNLDARLAMFEDSTQQNSDVNWSEYHQFLETRVFIKPKPPAE